MGNKEYAESLLQKQKDTLADIQTLITLLDEDRLLISNEEMQARLQQLEAQNKELGQNLTTIKDENIRLRAALNDQIINEKLNILKISRQKIDTYFEESVHLSEKSLDVFEKELKAQIKKSEKHLGHVLSEDRQQLQSQLSEIRSTIEQKLEERRQELEAGQNLSRGEIEERYRKLQEEGIDQKTLQKRMRENDFEINLGLSWMNRLGVLLILLGVATAIRLSYAFFGANLKGIISYTIGLLMLASGEFLMRRQKNIFAMGLSAGGIAVLYFATFSGYFFLHILSLNAGMLISVLITLVAIALSLRYNSKTICIYALIGGYLPFFSYVFTTGLQPPGTYVAMAYVFLLNTLVLAVSLQKKWQLLNYVAFLLNLPVFLYLLNISRSNPINLAFDLAMFALFLLIVLGYSLRQKVSLNIYDMVLLGVNTTLSCALACGIFARAGWNDYLGLLALIFALFYYGLGRVIDSVMKDEIITKLIFYLTSITFAILMVPFQFGIKWLTIGWTIEAILMIIWSLKNKVDLLEGVGWLVLLLNYATFVAEQMHLYGYAAGLNQTAAVYHFKYGLTTAGMIIALVVYYKYRSHSVLNRYRSLDFVPLLLKYVVILNTLVYGLRESGYVYDRYLVHWFHVKGSLQYYYRTILQALLTMLAALALLKYKPLLDKAVSVFALIMLVLVGLTCFGLTLNPLLDTQNLPADWVAFAFLVVFHLAVFASVRFVILRYIDKIKYNLEIYPLGQAIYIVVALTLILAVQFDWLSNIRFIISLANLMLAFAFVYYGLNRRFHYTRRMGLILAILACAKLFLFDLTNLNTVGRILAYFTFGLILLGISYLYQKMEKSIHPPDITVASGIEEGAQ